MSQRILNTIADGKVTPKPRWHFFLRHGGVWVLGAAATLCGAIAVSATLFVFVTAPLRFQPATHESILQFWVDFLPLIWIVMFVAFVFAADYAVKQTKKGYRYNVFTVTAVSAVLSLIIGYIGFLIGLGEFLENRIGSAIPFHTPVRVATQRALYQPEHGLLLGEVMLGEKATLHTLDGTVWNLDISNVPEEQRLLFAGTGPVGVVGTSTEDGVFAVCMVLPLDEPLPKPTGDERNSLTERTKVCKGVRPYERLQAKLMMNYENQ